MPIYTNKEEKEEYGKVLTKLLQKKFPFILNVDVYGLASAHFFEINCFITVPRDFILSNIKSVNNKELNFSIKEGIMPTFLFNDFSKGVKFNTEEFLKLSKMLFLSLHGKVSENSTYSIQFKFD